MIERKDYHAMDIVFTFFATFIDRVTGYTDEVRITAIHTTYLDLC